MNKKNEKQIKNNSEIEKKMEADIVIVGAGSAGLSAALAAASYGVKVVVLEKMASPGGYSMFTGGMFAVESSIQILDYIGITKDEAFKNHMQNSHWCANGRLVRGFINKSADTIDWLMQLGIEYKNVISMWPGGPRTWHRMEGGGKALIETLTREVKKRGVDILTETPVQRLIMDSKKQAKGILAQGIDGQPIQVNSKAVIIAGGSYANNKEMMNKYSNFTFGASSFVDMHQTGEHISMSWEAGAASDGMGVFMAIPTVPGEEKTSHLWSAALQPLLWINKSGQRFCDESITFYLSTAANSLSKQPDGIMYTIFDEITKNKMIEQGISAALSAYVPVTTKLSRLDNDIKRGIKEGKAFSADNSNELADKLCINRNTFKNTLDEFNSFFLNNHDQTYAKKNKYLQPVRKGKFYAIKSLLQILTTLGGIKINHNTEVLNNKTEVIPGLYAVGNCAGGLYGWDYNVFTTGGALGFAVNSGRIAAENSLKYIKKQKK